MCVEVPSDSEGLTAGGMECNVAASLPEVTFETQQLFPSSDANDFHLCSKVTLTSFYAAEVKDTGVNNCHSPESCCRGGIVQGHRKDRTPNLHMVGMVR